MTKITVKQKQFADELIKNPKLNATQAYLNTHMTEKRRSANHLAAQTLKKPEVKIYMQKYVDQAKRKVIELSQGADKQDIQLRASLDILDRSYGKAIQRSVNENTNLNLNIEASKELSDDFTAFLKSKTSV